MSLTIQFQTMIAMITMGACIGVFLDTYGRLLARSKRARWFVFVLDMLFWIIQGLLIFYVLLEVNNGDIRFYIFLALLCGYAAYRSLFQRLYLKCLNITISIIRHILRVIRQLFKIFIYYPIRALIQFIISVLLFTWQAILSICALSLKLLYLPLKMLGKLIVKLIPKKIIDFFMKLGGVFIRIKNYIIKWLRR